MYVYVYLKCKGLNSSLVYGPMCHNLFNHFPVVGVSILNEIMSLLEFEKDEDVEHTNLMKQAQKAWKRYCQKYEGTKLRNTVFRYLVSKGFDYDDVYNAVEEVEQEYDKD